MSNLALKEEEQTRSNIILIDRRTPERVNLGTLTSRGIPKAQRVDPITSLEDIERIKVHLLNSDTTYKYRNYALFCIGISVGLRISDLRRLRVCDLCNLDGTFKERIFIKEKKTSKINYPYINNSVKEAMGIYMNNVKLEYGDYLFPSRKGNEPISEGSIHKILKQIQRDLKLPYNIGTHSLRKTFAYWVIHNNKDNPMVLMALQEMLNHSDQRVTFRYAGITQEENDEIYESIGDLF